jgi:hypothetical protein
MLPILEEVLSHCKRSQLGLSGRQLEARVVISSRPRISLCQPHRLWLPYSLFDDLGLLVSYCVSSKLQRCRESRWSQPIHPCLKIHISLEYFSRSYFDRANFCLPAIPFIVVPLMDFSICLYFGSLSIKKGWSNNIFPEPSYISDGTRTDMLAAFILFSCPARSSTMLLVAEEDKKGDNSRDPSSNNDTALLNWDTDNKMHYDAVYLPPS